MSEPVRYDTLAFISYSRKDLALARRLHADIETYRLPARLSCDRSILNNGKRLRPIFRDQTDLDVRNDSFWAQVEAGILGSRYLLLICSPASAASQYVEREIRCFLDSRPDALEHILPILAGGNIEAKEEGPDQCLPPSLRPFRAELASRNLPTTRDASRLELTLKIASWMLRVNYGSLHATHRHRQRWRRAAIASATAVILAALGGAGWYAARQSEKATTAASQRDVETQRAEREQKAAARDDYFKNISQAARAIEQKDISGARTALAACAPDLRNWEWGYLQTQIDQSVGRFECGKAGTPVAASPDGTRLAICGADRHVRIYRVSDQAELLKLPAADDDLSAVAWGRIAEGQTAKERIATVSQAGTISVFDAATGKPIASHAQPECRAGQLQFSPDGGRLFFASTCGGVLALETESGKPLGAPMLTIGAAGHFAIAPQGRRVAALDIDGRRLRMFEVDGQTMLWERRPEGRGSLLGIDFSRDGRRLLVATEADGAWLVDAATGRTIATVGAPEAHVTHARFAHADSVIWLALAGGTAQTFTFFPLVDKVQDGPPFVAHATRLTGMTPYPYGMVLTACDDGTIAAWVATRGGGTPIARFQGHAGAVRGIRTLRLASEDTDGTGSFVTWSGADRTVRVWSMSRTMTPTGKVSARRSGYYAPAFDDSPDGRRGLMRMAGPETLSLVERPSGKRITGLKHDKGIGATAFARDGATLITGSYDTTAKVWMAADGKAVRTLAAHKAPVMAVDLSPDGKWAATGSDDGTVRIWEASTGILKHTLDHAGAKLRCVVFSPDGTRLASSDEAGKVIAWDVAGGTRVATMAGHSSDVRRIAFTRDGARLTSASTDATARIWDAATGSLFRQFDPGHPLADAAISPDGSRLVTLGADAELSVFDVDSAKLIVQAPLRADTGHRVRFSDDGGRIIATPGAGSVLTLLGGTR